MCSCSNARWRNKKYIDSCMQTVVDILRKDYYTLTARNFLTSTLLHTTPQNHCNLSPQSSKMLLSSRMQQVGPDSACQVRQRVQRSGSQRDRTAAPQLTPTLRPILFRRAPVVQRVSAARITRRSAVCAVAAGKPQACRRHLGLVMAWWLTETRC